MGLAEKVEKFDLLVDALFKSSSKPLPKSIQKTQEVAARFEKKLAQIQTFPNPSNLGVSSPYVSGTEPTVGPKVEPDATMIEQHLKGLNAPAVKELDNPAPKTTQPIYGDPETIKLLQTFLNNSLREEVINGSRSPLVVDGKLGKDTTAALNMWASKYNVHAKDLQELVNIALNKSKSASIKNDLVKLADKFENKY